MSAKEFVIVLPILGMISEIDICLINLSTRSMNIVGTITGWKKTELSLQVPGKWKVCLASAIASASFRRCWAATAMILLLLL